MSGPVRGVEALLLVPTPSVPTARGIVSPRLRDHIHGFLLWMEHARARAANTVRAYGEDIRMFVAFAEKSGFPDARQIDHNVIEAFGAVLRAHLGQKETTVSRRYSSLRMFFLYLQRLHIVDQNPAALALTMKMPPRKPPQYMTQAERETILDRLRRNGSVRGRRNYTLCATMFLAGLRVSEVCHLRLEDVDLHGATLYIRESKGRKDRRVPITPRLVRILQLWIDGQRQKSRGGGAASPWVFTRTHRVEKQGPMHTRAVYNMVRKKIPPILGRNVSPHAFRHSYSTHVYEESGDIRLVQHLVGHDSIRTTQIYTHVTPRKERERLEQYLGESGGKRPVNRNRERDARGRLLKVREVAP
jgi:site-specific recombinase XerD